jgi:hypothetical protein
MIACGSNFMLTAVGDNFGYRLRAQPLCAPQQHYFLGEIVPQTITTVRNNSRRVAGHIKGAIMLINVHGPRNCQPRRGIAQAVNQIAAWAYLGLPIRATILTWIKI